MSVLAVDSWTVAARRLGTPEYTKAHRTVINHFLKFYSQLVVVLPNLPKSLPKYPSQHVLSSFVGYLACQPSLGGTTLRGYMARLPTALWMYHCQPEAEPKLVLPKSVKLMMDRAAWRIPQVNPVLRDAVSLPELVAVTQDPQADELVVSAMVLQYSLGVRGINVYSTGKSRSVGKEKERPLQWRDIRFLPAANGEPDTWMVTVRQEKTATSYSGSFAPKPLTRSPDPTVLPCPVHALEVAEKFRASDKPSALVFPGVRDDAVNSLLTKHSAQGKKLTTHSLRKGRVTSLKEAGMDGSEMRLAGNWSNDHMPDKYVAPSGRHADNVNAELIRALSNAATPSVSDDGQRLVLAAMGAHISQNTAASATEFDSVSEVGASKRTMRLRKRVAHSCVGTIRCPDGGLDRLILLCQYSLKYFRGYYYCSETHSRCDYQGVSHRGMQPYEPFTHMELEYLIEHSTAMEKQPGRGTDLEKDREQLNQAVYAKRYAIVAGRRKNVGQRPAARARPSK